MATQDSLSQERRKKRELLRNPSSEEGDSKETAPDIRIVAHIEKGREVAYDLLDATTGEVLRRIPAEEVGNLSEHLREYRAEAKPGTKFDLES